MSLLQRAWLRRGGLAALLWPLSLPYGALAALDRSLYTRGLRQAQRLSVPVVVVGNVVAGGAVCRGDDQPVGLDLRRAAFGAVERRAGQAQELDPARIDDGVLSLNPVP